MRDFSLVVIQQRYPIGRINNMIRCFLGDLGLAIGFRAENFRMGYPYNSDLLINLEIKKKSGSSINPDIHHSKVPSSGYPILMFFSSEDLN